MVILISMYTVIGFCVFLVLFGLGYELNRIAKDMQKETKIEKCEYCGEYFEQQGNNKRCPDCVRKNMGREIIE